MNPDLSEAEVRLTFHPGKLSALLQQQLTGRMKLVGLTHRQPVVLVQASVGSSAAGHWGRGGYPSWIAGSP